MDEMNMIVSNSLNDDDEKLDNKIDKDDSSDQDASAARQNLVTRWVADINKAKGVHQPAFDRMKKDMDLAFHGFDPTLWDDSKYVVNLAQRHVQQRTAALYAKNPRSVAKPRQRLHATIWDGKQESIVMAMQAKEVATQNGMPVPQITEMVLAEYSQIQKQKIQTDKICKTLEILFHYFMQESQPSFKSQMKALVRRMLTTSVGFVKLGFQREMTRRPEISARMNDVQVQLDHLERLAGELEEGELSESSADYDELMTAMKELAKEADVVVREGLMFDFPDSNAIIIDPRCKQLRGFIGARWIAHEMFFSSDEIMEIYGKDVSGNYTPYSVQNKSHDTSRRTMSTEGSKDNGEDGMVCVYEIYDKPSGLMMTVAEGFKDFLLAPTVPDLRLETFWPIYSLVCNEVEHDKEIYPPSDVHLIRSMVMEYNRAREGLREHRRANRPAYLTPAGLLEEEEKEKLVTRPAHAVISIQGMQPGQKSDELVTPLKTVGIDPNLYEVSSVVTDVQLAVGAQEAQLGGTSGATATENSIAESARMSALGAQVDELDSFMSEIARASGQVLLAQMSAEQVKIIAGRGAVWPELTAHEIAGEVLLEIEAGSTGKPNMAAELRNIERVLPYIIQIPGIDPKWLAKEVLKRMDDKLDLDEALSENAESIVAMNGMKDANAAAGMQQGVQGSMNAPQQGSPAGGSTGSGAS